MAAQRQWRLALSITALLSVIAIFGAAVFHVMLVQSEFRLEKLDAQATAGIMDSPTATTADAAQAVGYDGGK